MLGKLLKHEFKATSRTFVPLYIVIIVVSFLNGLFLNPNNPLSNIQGIGITVLVGLFVALGVLTIIVTIQRFSKNLLGDEGYLMFTLPVSPKKLLLSKTIVSTVWCILSGITSMISFVIIGFLVMIKSADFSSADFKLIWTQLKILVTTEEFRSGLLFGIELIGLMILSYVVFILIVYLSISIGQLPIFYKHRKLAGFVAFFIINIIINYIGFMIPEDIIFSSNYVEELNRLMLLSYLGTIVAGVVLFFGTSFILEKKLNLE